MLGVLKQRSRYGCGAVGVREKRLDFLGMRAYNRRASEFLNRPV